MSKAMTKEQKIKDICENANGSWVDMITEGFEAGESYADQYATQLKEENERLSKAHEIMMMELLRIYRSYGYELTREIIVGKEIVQDSEMFKAFSVWLFMTFCFYIAGSVASANMSIANWDETTRGIVASFWIIATIITTVVHLADISD